MEQKRLSVTLDGDIVEGVEAVKKELFYDKPYSELIRFLIKLGIQSVEEGAK